MRRAFVIFLILLFPLNVFALSMSVSSMGQADAPHVSASDAPAMQSMGDIDADEPPTGTDFHDSLDAPAPPRLALLPGRLPSSHPPSRQGRAPSPPIKPPPVR
ncbi:hypothetical protein [Massilia sp. Leaf139]|uniref:hypothetical protein n=1 Tax=Massilia sp. Leaf139 TaxID=1736272 RepID=UPI0006FFAA48|nr:hypothetical protein [Massilia sp. Leaf139]KQQ96494.1 hypothetical protein ASF77_00355 [Massilia sp. Leaf139]